MNSDCERIKERITDSVTGTLPKAETDELGQHLSQCPPCKAFAQSLADEELVVTKFFSEFDSVMDQHEEQVIQAINRIEPAPPSAIASILAGTANSTIARHAFAAAVIIVVSLYFIITLTWISQINECIKQSM